MRKLILCSMTKSRKSFLTILTDNTYTYIFNENKMFENAKLIEPFPSIEVYLLNGFPGNKKITA